MNSNVIYDSIIIGGGLSGILFSYRLSKNGKKVFLAEAQSSLGGSVASVKIKDLLIDSGAESFSLSSDATIKLIEELDLSKNLVSPEPLESYLKLESKLLPIPKGLLGIPGDLTAPNLADLFTTSELAEAKKLDSLAWNLPEVISLGSLVENRFGLAFVEKLLTPVVMGVYANSPYSIEANFILPDLVAKAKEIQSLEKAVSIIRAKNLQPGANVKSLKSGMHSLISALVMESEKLGATLMLNEKVFAANYHDDFWWIETQNKVTIGAKSLIVACPAPQAENIFQNYPKIENLLGQFQTKEAQIVLLLIESSKLNSFPVGTGCLRVDGLTSTSAKATTHISAKWKWIRDLLPENIHLIRLSYNAKNLHKSASIGTEEINRDIRDFYNLKSSDFEILEMQQIYWKDGLSQIDPGHSSLLQELARVQSEFSGLTFAGSMTSGSGITSLIEKTNAQLKDH
jgi:protoporphyrinogen/coproporphyrinogen III oxidase